MHENGPGEREPVNDKTGEAKIQICLGWLYGKGCCGSRKKRRQI